MLGKKCFLLGDMPTKRAFASSSMGDSENQSSIRKKRKKRCVGPGSGREIPLMPILMQHLKTSSPGLWCCLSLDQGASRCPRHRRNQTWIRPWAVVDGPSGIVVRGDQGACKNCRWHQEYGISSCICLLSGPSCCRKRRRQSQEESLVKEKQGFEKT